MTTQSNEKDQTIHERLAAIIGCPVDDERLDDIFEFIQADRQIEAARAFNEGTLAQREATRAAGGDVGQIVRVNPYAQIYCPNCGHLIERHPGEILCLNPEHTRCEWTPEQIRAALLNPPGLTTTEETE